MRANGRADTRPEVALRRELHRRGLRFRKHLAIVAGAVRVRPDIVFPLQRVAVFIDGCFWHCCTEHGTSPQANAGYWAGKLTRNRQRDARVNDSLAKHGWRIIRIWEHVPVADAATYVAAALAVERRCS
jgi:DNA mismatch endonuclease (patch repair protein)